MRRSLIINLHQVASERSAAIDSGCPYTISTDCLRALVAELPHWRARGIEIGLTFDDGNASDYELAMPILLESGLSAKFFVLAGRIGHKGYLSANQIREMQAAGMTIGNHGYDHLDWRKLDDDQLRREVRDARLWIEDVTGSVVSEVAIPFGQFDRRVIVALLAEPYSAIHTSSGGFLLPGRRLLPRNSLTKDFLPERDIARLSSGREFIRALLRDGYWRARFGRSLLLVPLPCTAAGA